MGYFPIGTLADWFGVGYLEGIKESARVGASGVQLYAWNELAPKNVTAGIIATIKNTAKDSGQVITALCGELGGHGLEIAKDNEQKIDYLKRVLDIALELDCNIVTTHFGVIPEDKNDAKYKAIFEAGQQLSEYAIMRGGYFAVETGPEIIARLKSTIDACGKGLAVNYDPANLVMVTGDDEVAGVYTAGSSIVHTHAKDGVCNIRIGPEKFFDIFANGGIEAVAQANYSSEQPLGQGEVRWPLYLKALKDIGYKGFLTIEREVGKDAKKDIKLAVDFLNQAMKSL